MINFKARFLNARHQNFAETVNAVYVLLKKHNLTFVENVAQSYLLWKYSRNE